MTSTERAAGTKQDDQSLHRNDDLEQELLIAAFVLWYGAILKAVHEVTITFLGIGPIPLSDPSVAQMVLKARAAAVAVDNTTRKQIARTIAEGAQMGLSPAQIATGTDDFPGISGLFDVTWKGRPEMVARTELQKAQLAATVQQWGHLARGRIAGWLANDGDYDAQCAARDGRVYPAGNPPDLLHPNCRLTISPILN